MPRIIYLFLVENYVCIYSFLQFRFTVNCDLYYVLNGVYNVIRHSYWDDREVGLIYIYLRINGPGTAINVVHAHINQLLSSIIPYTMFNLYIYYYANGLNNIIELPYGFNRPHDPIYIANREYETHQRVYDGRYSPRYIISNYIVSRNYNEYVRGTMFDILYPF